MSHDFATGEHFLSTGQSVWHQLGTVIPEEQSLSVAEAMKTTHMDWAPRVTPVTSPADIERSLAENGEVKAKGTAWGKVPMINVWRPADCTDGSVRMIHMGTHGMKYEPLDNAILFQHVQELLDVNPDMRIECAGQLGDGKVPFMLLSSGSAVIGGGDQLRNFLLVLSSHDGSHSTSGFPTTVRVCCANTMAMAIMQGRTRIKVKHTKQQEGGLEMLFQALEYSEGVFTQNTAKFQAMAEAKITDGQAENYLRAVFSLPKEKTDKVTKSRNKLEQLMAAWEADKVTSDGFGIGNEVHGGDKTAWRVLNVATEFMTHHNRRDLKSSANHALGKDGQRELAFAMDAAEAYTVRAAQDNTPGF